METACTYCESDVYDHEPIFLTEQVDDDRQSVGQFCNYACLSTFIDEQNLTDGACCHIDL